MTKRRVMEHKNFPMDAFIRDSISQENLVELEAIFGPMEKATTDNG
jgi:hypothetical protein